MPKLLLSEKYNGIDFPKYNTYKFEFVQGNKAIVIKKDKAYYKHTDRYNWFQIGYLTINRRDVPVELYNDISKDFLTFKENFYIKTKLKNVDDKEIDVIFGLHSITNKKNHTVFGFGYRNFYHVGSSFNEEKAIPVEKFLNMLNQMEKKIQNYGKK